MPVTALVGPSTLLALPTDLSRAKILAAVIAFLVAILLALMVFLCLRWAAARVARSRIEGGKRTPTPKGSPWGEAASRVEVESTGLTGEGGAGPRIIQDPAPRAKDPPAQFDVFEVDDADDDASLDETAEDDPGSPDDTDAFDFDPDDEDDPDDEWGDDDEWRGA